MCQTSSAICIITKEWNSWDKMASVAFQDNEQVMIDWIRNDWGCYYTNKPTPGPIGKIADIHRGQQTEAVKALLAKTKTVLQNIPGGLTSYLQVVDVTVNRRLRPIFKSSQRNISSRMLMRTLTGRYSPLNVAFLLHIGAAMLGPVLIESLLKDASKSWG